MAARHLGLKDVSANGYFAFALVFQIPLPTFFYLQTVKTPLKSWCFLDSASKTPLAGFAPPRLLPQPHVQIHAVLHIPALAAVWGHIPQGCHLLQG